MQQSTRRLKNHQDDLVISYGGHSNKGDKSENQDAFALKKNQGLSLELKGHIAVIADGVSSANCAAKASQIGTCHFIDEYMATPETWSIKHAATKVISSLNRWLYAQQLVADDQGRLEQWFTTFTALILKGNLGHLFHIGDCQVAKINKSGYQVLTKEHASISGTLNRALGAGTHVEIDMIHTPLAQHDILMLSCDGVHHFVKTKQVENVLAEHNDLEQASVVITQLAKAQGSPDNLTCLLIKIEQLPTQAFSQLVFNRKQQVIPPALRIGSQLDHYEILDTLQETSRSHVYLAKNTQYTHSELKQSDTEKLVVIKAPSLNFSDNEDYVKGFIKEGWIGHKISHPAIMKIYDNLPNGRFLYHVCEYVEGQNLADWSKDNPQASLIKVRDIVGQLVKALRVLQRYEIVHCDIKPDNFIIDSNGRVKLIDFGKSQIGSVDSEFCEQTALGLGTLNYSAPELFYNQENNHQSELFSVAVLTYQLLTNRLPYRELSQVNEAPKQYHLWRYKPITTYRKDLPRYLDIVLAKALSANPNQRYEHYSEFISALNSSDTSIKTQASLPLIEREPVKFWQGVSAVLFVLLLTALFI
jgi:serine/threonine protein phosphatase PrpC/predicted Ser/Thr protein kinase